MRITTDKSSKRMWIWFGDSDHITLEMGRWFPLDFGFHLEVAMEDITLGFYLGVVDFYVSLDWKPITRFLGAHPNYKFKHTIYRGTPEEKVEKGAYWQERNIGLRLDLRAWTFAGEWWVDMNDQPRKRHFYWFLQDKVFGRAQYSEEVYEERETSIDMPEGVYRATYKRFISYWKRPRFPKVQSLHRIEMDIPVGIPHEGKGENSWDMGMDATFGVTMPADKNKSMYQITKEFAISCLKTRQKYGNLHSPDYAKWKLEGEVRVEKANEMAKQAGIPETLVPRGDFGEIKEREQ